MTENTSPADDSTSTESGTNDSPQRVNTGVRLSVPMASGVLDPQQPFKAPPGSTESKRGGRRDEEPRRGEFDASAPRSSQARSCTGPGDNGPDRDAGYDDESDEPGRFGVTDRDTADTGDADDLSNRGSNRSEWGPGDECPVCGSTAIGAWEVQENDYSAENASMQHEKSGDVVMGLKYWCRNCKTTLYQHPLAREFLED